MSTLSVFLGWLPLPWLDMLALLWFAVWWSVYVWYSDYRKSRQPALRRETDRFARDWIAPGCLYISLDRDSYVTDGAIDAMDLILSDDREALFHARDHEASFSHVSRVDADLLDIARGTAAMRRGDEERVGVFVNGLGIEDLAAAVTVFRAAEENDAGLVLAPQYS